MQTGFALQGAVLAPQPKRGKRRAAVLLLALAALACLVRGPSLRGWAPRGFGFGAQTAGDVDPVVVEVLQGVAEGFGLQVDVDCLQESTHEVEDLKAAAELYKSKESAQTQEAIRKLGMAIQGLPDAVATCKKASTAMPGDIEALKKAARMMTHPSRFAWHVGKDLVLNGVDIYKEVHAGMTAYNQKQWKACGKDIGVAMKLLAIGKQRGGKPDVADDDSVIEVHLFHEFGTDPSNTTWPGLRAAVWPTVLHGVAAGFGLEDVGLKCFRRATVEVPRVEKAIERVDREDLLGGLEDLVVVLEGGAPSLLPSPGALRIGVAEHVEQCAAFWHRLSPWHDYAADAQLLRDATALLQHPDLVQHLIRHDSAILRSVESAAAAYRVDDWAGFGENMGKALRQLHDAAQRVEWRAVLRGVTNGFGLNMSLGCFNRSSVEVWKVHDALQYVKRGGLPNVLPGLEKLATLLTGVPRNVRHCRSLWRRASPWHNGRADAQKLQAALAFLKHPWSADVTAGEELLLNGVDLLKQVAGMVQAYQDRDWAAFGENIGAALQKLYEGSAGQLEEDAGGQDAEDAEDADPEEQAEPEAKEPAAEPTESQPAEREAAAPETPSSCQGAECTQAAKDHAKEHEKETAKEHAPSDGAGHDAAQDADATRIV